MKTLIRIVLVILLVSICSVALAQSECPGSRCPEESPQAPTCLSFQTLASVVVVFYIVRKK